MGAPRPGATGGRPGFILVLSARWEARIGKGGPAIRMNMWSLQGGIMVNLLMNLQVAHLFKCRVVIARVGEMDQAGAGWWNTTGLLGTVGVAAIRRNFPHTHWFAQARAVIAVASSRCSEVFPLPKGCVSLWHLRPEIEAALSEAWPQWLRDETTWRPFFETVAILSGESASEALQRLKLAGPTDVSATEPLKRSHEAKALLVPTREPMDDVAIAHLALGFAHSEPGKLTVPYMRLSGGLS
jgi:hypothetical protein